MSTLLDACLHDTFDPNALMPAEVHLEDDKEWDFPSLHNEDLKLLLHSYSAPPLIHSFSLREERAEEVQRFLLASKARLDLPDSNGATWRHFQVSRLCASC